MWVQQVASQPIAVITFYYFLKQVITATHFVCFAGCHAPCSSPTLHSGSYCVLHLPLFIHSSLIPFHHVRSQTFVAQARYPLLNTNQRLLGDMPSSQAIRSLGSIPINRRFFISARFRPPAAYVYFCSPVGHRLRCGALLARSQAHASMPHKTPSLCAHHGLTPFYWSPQSLALAVRFR